MKSRIDKLKELLRTVSTELIEEVDGKYQDILDYPHNQSKYDLDTESARAALAFIEEIETI